MTGLMELQATEEVRTLGEQFVKRGALPGKAEIDAYHVAITAVNGVEYLLTWNCTQIANAHTRPKMESACRVVPHAGRHPWMLLAFNILSLENIGEKDGLGFGDD